MRTTLAVALLLMAAGCSEPDKIAGPPPALATKADSVDGLEWSGVGFTASEQAAVLEMANEATFAQLDVDIGLVSTAATNIVAARPIGSMDALDAVPYVGKSALQALKAYVPQWTGEPDPDEQLLTFVNHPSVDVEELDNIPYIGPTQASGIVNYRATNPIDSVDELLSASASEGASPLADHQLDSMRNYAGSWRPPDAGGFEPGTWGGVTFSGYEVSVAMDLVNQAPIEELDDDVGLASNAAQNIVVARPLSTMDELDAVPYVATQAFQRLKAYVPNWNPPTDGGQPDPDPGVTVSGVYFSADEAEVALDVANRASVGILDGDVGLDNRAANNIVAARPLADLHALDAVSYVGASALEKLKTYLPSWDPDGGGDPGPEGGTYDGVEFDAQEEATALDIANRATSAQLAEGAVSTTPRNIILSNRPWATLGVLAAYSGIGPGTMTALKNKVPGWQGPENPPAEVSIQTLADEAMANGEASQYFEQFVSVQRAIITSAPHTTSAGNVYFQVADPRAGDRQQLKVYIATTAGQNSAFASIYDDVKLIGRFTRYGSEFQVKLDDPEAHVISLSTGGLAYDAYLTVQAAWHSTSANPEGVVRVVATFDYTYMVPLPVFLDHPMWNDSPPGPPHDSGNEQDHNWNIAAQQALNAWWATLP